MRLPALLFSIALLAPVDVQAAEAPRLDTMRVLGSHNSYRPELDPGAKVLHAPILDHAPTLVMR